MKKTCRELLEYFMKEYNEVGKEWFLNESFNAEKMLCFLKLAKMVKEAHEVYHIAIELETGHERDWHGDHEHTHEHIEEQSMPIPRAIMKQN